MVRFHRYTFVVVTALGCASANTASVRTTLAPDLGKRLVADHAVVSSASPLASEAGVEILRAGGNAVDAAVATAFTIGVVEPQMSGLGGGGAMLVWLQQPRTVEYVDFYSAQNAASFRGHTDRDRGDTDLRIVGIPGEVAGLLEAHERFGRLPLAQVMAPAIRLAENGFPVNQILAQMIAGDSAKLNRFPETARVFWPDGKPLAAGVTLRNAELAATLRAVAARGRAGFYEGDVASALVQRLNDGGHPATLADLAAFPVRWKRPLCADYRGRTVLSAPPPQTGSQVLHTLELIEPFELAAMGLPTHSARAFDVLVSALRVGMADNRANDDPAWRRVPAAGIASEAFARERSALVGRGAPADTIRVADASAYDAEAPESSCTPYNPYRGAQAVGAGSGAAAAADDTTAGGETTHISVVDAEGNAVALTQTNSTLFGSGARAAGFFLNDSGFRFTDANIDAPAATTWRTRTSTISPTIVLEDGRVHMVVGAPGGGRIPTAITQVMVYALDYGLDPLEAIRMPRVFPSASGRQVQLENGFRADVLHDVRAMGYEPAALSFGYARLYMIVRRAGQWIGAADPRHDGEVRGY